MAKKSARIIIGLECITCKSRNYVTKKSKINDPDKMTLNKYCKKERVVSPHKEVAKLK